MNNKYHYKSEDNNDFIIYFKKYGEKSVSIYISNDSSTNNVFFSNIHLDDLNFNFQKLIQFKTIEEFMKVLIENINKKYLILNVYYKNSITSIWRLYPNSKDKTHTFSFTFSSCFSKSITLLFYSNFKTSLKIIKEIENSIQVENSDQTKELFYLKLSYKEHWLIDNMYFLSGKYDNEEKKTKDFLKLYDKAIENRDKNEEKRILLVFFDYPKLLESLKNIISKLYMQQPFILIFTEKGKKIF